MGEKNVLSVKYFHSYVMGEDSSLSGYSDPIVYKKTFFKLQSLLKQSCPQRQTQTLAFQRLHWSQQEITGCGVNTPFCP